MKHRLSTIITSLFLISPIITWAQSTVATSHPVYNAPYSAVPFLTISPDSRGAALGDAGVAASPDANSAYWNVAKLAFIDKQVGASVSYTPWLRDLIDDMAILNASVYKKVAKDQTVGLSLTYFNQGQIEFTSTTGASEGTYVAKEFALTGSYARKLSQNLSMGINLRYINSNLLGTQVVSGVASRAGVSVAGDIGVYYVKNYKMDKETGKGTTLALGAAMSNIGGKINYGRSDYFLPANLKIGGALTKRIDNHNKFTWLVDFNKLLVPSQPVYQTNADGSYVLDANGNKIISLGRDPNRGAIDAIFSSFTDAPYGFKEELRFINMATGLEYWYDDIFAARAGYHYESQSIAGRQYFTAGLGLRIKESFGIDLAYLIPTSSGSPLANTWRISLIFDLDSKKSTSPVTVPTGEKTDNE